MSEETHVCEWEGCESTDTQPCYLEPRGDDIPDYWYCWEHIHDAGFCKGCGQFWGGVEMFDFGDGFCDNCKIEMDDYEDEWDDDPYMWDDYNEDWYRPDSDLDELEDDDTPRQRFIGDTGE